MSAKELADNACNDLIDLIGKPEYIKKIDQRFPGPDDMKIDADERLQWAREEIKRFKERPAQEGHNVMTWEQSEHLRVQHVCSDCWCDCSAQPVQNDLYLVKCKTVGCTTPGFVSRATIKFRARVSDEYKYLAVRSIRSGLPWFNNPNIDIDKLIKGSNDMTTPRQAVSFPDVAIIHKGSPKKIMEKDGRKIEIQGDDLKNKFRIHFLPGTDDVRASWHAKHTQEYKKYGDKFAIPDGYEVENLRVVIPAPSVWDAWDYGNECYNSGRRVASADDDHYISLRDPNTGEFTIQNGKPFRKFTPKDTISYERKGKKYTLQMKTHGRLRLVLEDLVNAGHLVQVILKTTSFYDCQNIKKQLAGIQVIADSVNGGNAGGIPLLIYRAEQEVAWNHEDGSASRVKKWFINIKADPRWVQSAFARMGKNALTGSSINSLLLPAGSIQGDVNPDAETFESGDEGPQPEYVDATAQDIPPEPEQTPQPEAQPDPAAKAVEGAAKYKTLGETVVKTVSKRAGITTAEAAKALGAAEKAGKIGKELSVKEAEDFGAHLDIPEA